MFWTRLVLPAIASLSVNFLAIAQADTNYSLQQRTECQTTLEDLRWSHLSWPKENPQPKPERASMLSTEQIRAKVEHSLNQEAGLKQSYGLEITDAMLQAELDRMAENTRDPKRLKEIFNALDNDPRKIGECVARPNLVSQQFQKHKDDQPEAGSQSRVVSSQASNAPAMQLSLPRIKPAASAQVDSTTDSGVWLRMDANSIPSPRTHHTAVWTGSEMIVWGGMSDNGDLLNDGGRYDPVTDSWKRVGTYNAPSAREGSTAVWTGKEMIVWGGSNADNVGYAYNPQTDSWVPMPVEGAPVARVGHTAIWTGTEMIIWGGQDSSGYTNTGARYNPASRIWLPTNLSHNIAKRGSHLALWTGGEMIIWGGDSNNADVKIGWRYSPTSDSWKIIDSAGQPSYLTKNVAVWADTEMILNGWEGGFRYSPETNTWRKISSLQQREHRWDQTSVWTGSYVLIYGGQELVDGFTDLSRSLDAYDPKTDSWQTVWIDDNRIYHTAVWTGDEMLIWGGTNTFSPNGLRINGDTFQWSEMNKGSVPQTRRHHNAVWTGNEMLIVGGSELLWNDHYNTGAVLSYDPATDRWSELPNEGAPNTASDIALWTGEELIVWPKGVEGLPIIGSRFNPTTGVWTHIPTVGSHLEWFATAVWTGSEMIVFGGGHPDDLSENFIASNNGARYNPKTNQWTVLNSEGAPFSEGHSAVWTGSQMLVWGGSGEHAIYDLSSDSWHPMSSVNAPEPRVWADVLWTGDEMVVWGGIGREELSLGSGGKYNPKTDLWTNIPTENAPLGRRDQQSVWTGEEMLFWSGWGTRVDPYTDFIIEFTLSSGGRYDPLSNIWLPMSEINAPGPLNYHSAVWAENKMLVWGGNIRDAAIFAYYPTAPSFTLDVSINGLGSVISHPEGINCPGQCSAEFPIGTEVSLEVIPDRWWGGDGHKWSGDCSGRGDCGLVMDSDSSVQVQTYLQPICAFPYQLHMEPFCIGMH